MGSKTLTDYRNAIRANLMTKDVGNKGHWPDDRLDEIIHQAREWTFGEVIAAFDSQDDAEANLTTASDGSVDLPADFVREVAMRRGSIGDGGSDFVEFVTTTALRTRHPNHDPMGAMDWKELWRIVANKAIPVRQIQPTAAGSPYCLTYVKALARFDSNNPTAPASTERMSDRTFNTTVWKATALCLELTQNQFASRWDGRAREEADKIRSEVARRSLSTQNQIEDVMGYSRDEDSRYTGVWW